jgi:hypothetical protein
LLYKVYQDTMRFTANLFQKPPSEPPTRVYLNCPTFTTICDVVRSLPMKPVETKVILK